MGRPETVQDAQVNDLLSTNMNFEFIASTQFLPLYTDNVVHIDFPMSWKLQNHYMLHFESSSETVRASRVSNPNDCSLPSSLRAISIALSLDFFTEMPALEALLPTSLLPSIHPTPARCAKLCRVRKTCNAGDRTRRRIDKHYCWYPPNVASTNTGSWCHRRDDLVKEAGTTGLCT